MKNIHPEQDTSPTSIELGQLRHFSELLLRFLPIGVVVIDRNYRIITANGTGRRLLSMRDITNDQDFLHSVRGIPYTEVRSAIDTVFRERTSVTLPEVELDSATGGNNRFVFLSIARMQIEPGIPDVAAISVTDVIEQVQMQYQHTLESILHQSRRLNSMISEMLDIARVHGTQLELHNQEHVELVALVQHVIENVTALSHRSITLETTVEAITGTWDDARVEQVLNNLLTNALKYSAEDQPVTITIERNAHEVIVAVRDRGQGISEQQQAHIFDRFYRARTNENRGADGLGLGLYIAHEIVTLQGGRMWLESILGEGSTFYFSLPLVL